MAHGDDKGLVLPPRVAPVQVVVIPIVKASLSPEALAALRDYAAAIHKALKAAKVRESPGKEGVDGGVGRRMAPDVT